MAYHHPGHQHSKHLSTVNRTVSFESKESRWIAEIMEVMDEVVTTYHGVVVLR